MIRVWNNYLLNHGYHITRVILILKCVSPSPEVRCIFDVWLWFSLWKNYTHKNIQITIWTGLYIDICDPIASYDIGAVSYTKTGAKTSADLRCVFVSLILTGSEQCQVTLLYGWRENGSKSFYHIVVHIWYLAAIDQNIVQIAHPLGRITCLLSGFTNVLLQHGLQHITLTS